MRGCSIALALLMGMAACTREPDAQAIAGAIERMVAAADAHHSRDVLAEISDDFIGNDGELDRTQLADLLRAQFIAGRGVRVQVASIDTQLQGDRATARFVATLTDSTGRWITDRHATLDFVTGWRRERGVWRCYNAHWKQQ